jgi:hypothetical protein
MRGRRAVAAVGGGGSVDGEEWQLTGEVFWQAPGAKVSHFRRFLWLELRCICRILPILGWICLHRLCIASASALSIVLQTKACKEEVQSNLCKEEEGAKTCNCLAVLRELAAENMVLRQQVEDKKVLVTSLKKQCIILNAQLRCRDRKELCWLLVAICACIVAVCAMFVRF